MASCVWAHRPLRRPRFSPQSSCGSSRSDAELAQVMVKVLEHQSAPLFSAEPAKEWVYLRRGRHRTSSKEPVDESRKARALLLEIPFFGDAEVGARWGVLRERPLAEEPTPNEWCDKPAK